MDFCARLGDNDLAVGTHESGNHKLAMDNAVEAQQSSAVDKLVGDLVGYQVGLALTLLLLAVDLLDLLVDLHAEDCLEKENRADDAEHSERIGGGIAHRHGVHRRYVGGSLLGGGETGSIGHRTRHDTHKSLDRGSPVDIIY